MAGVRWCFRTTSRSFVNIAPTVDAHSSTQLHEATKEHWRRLAVRVLPLDGSQLALTPAGAKPDAVAFTVPRRLAGYAHDLTRRPPLFNASLVDRTKGLLHHVWQSERVGRLDTTTKRKVRANMLTDSQ